MKTLSDQLRILPSASACMRDAGWSVETTFGYPLMEERILPRNFSMPVSPVSAFSAVFPSASTQFGFNTSNSRQSNSVPSSKECPV